MGVPLAATSDPEGPALARTEAEPGATAGRASMLSAGERRRFALLAGAFALPAILMAVGLWQAWALLALPLALAGPLGGRRGLVATASLVALALALVSGRPEIAGLTLVLGFAGFLATAVAVGALHAGYVREVRRVTSALVRDRLTGLYTFGFFESALRRECRRARRYGQPLSLVMLDVDHFKAFNDRHGHEAGNRLLALVGQTMRASTRSSDIAARYGGEELALIVPGPIEEALAAAERVRTAVAAITMIVAGGARAGATISAGVAEHVPEGDEDGSRLLDRADAALYDAKEGGRDRVSSFVPEQRWARLGAGGT